MKSEEIYTCYHCGNTGILKNLNTFDCPEYIEDCDEYGNIIYQQLVENTNWRLYQCPVCSNPVLISEYTCAWIPEEYSEIKYEFPSINISYEGVPENIKNAFESAIKTKGIDRAICLLSLRRTLEMICKNKGAKGSNLESKIDDLIQKKVLPEMMKDACWIIRQSGNDAAHADDVVYSENEVVEVIGYVATIINYLYSMPVRMSKLRKRIEGRK